MKDDFVETSNYRRFTAALKRVDERGAQEACMVILDGEPGLGKTTTVHRWATQNNSVYVRAQKSWDYRWMMRDILTELGIAHEGIRGDRARFSRVVQEFKDRARSAVVMGQTFGLVIDECDLISGKKDVMEGVRGISDITFMPTILVGMGTLRNDLSRYKQIESRAPNKVKFSTADIEDTRALIDGKCDVPVADDLAAFVAKTSNGYSREILDAIMNIERFGRRFDYGEDGVRLSDMAGQVIMSDRATGKDIVVPGGSR